ncbi:MAG: PIN domain-containing protein [Balneolaceae bacterium]|nr:PIN domain-containing protein [Balneolaceae bacterium]
MSIFIDTGPLYAFFDRRDQYNRWTGEQFANITQPLIACEAVIAETVFLMLGSGISPSNLFEFAHREHLQILPVLNKREGLERVREIISKYSNLPASVADASLLYLAENKRDAEIFTLDHHFTIYRTPNDKPISLISPF